VEFSFGRNWEDFIEKHFSEERVEISRKHLLDFLEVEDLKGRTFLDVGCGSGLHSLSAFRSGADRIISLDVDPASVRTARKLHEREGKPSNWEIHEGSILDEAFVKTLQPTDLVYSWGVLHHTGDMWTAIDHTCGLVAPGGQFYLALYDYDTVASGKHSPEFWLDVKKMYNEVGWLEQRIMEVWYLWDFQLGRKRKKIPKLLRQMREYKQSRGMSYFTDVRDWLGGWPMDFARVPDVEKFCGERGLKQTKLSTGEANSEFLYERPHES